MGNYILSVVVMVLLAGPNLWAQEETAETTTKAEEVKEEVKAEQPQEESSPSEAGVEKIDDFAPDHLVALILKRLKPTVGDKQQLASLS